MSCNYKSDSEIFSENVKVFEPSIASFLARSYPLIDLSYLQTQIRVGKHVLSLYWTRAVRLGNHMHALGARVETS